MKINDDARETYNNNRQVKSKATMLKSSLCDSSDVYILVKWPKLLKIQQPADTNANNINKKVLFTICTPFINSDQTLT